MCGKFFVFPIIFRLSITMCGENWILKPEDPRVHCNTVLSGLSACGILHQQMLFFNILSDLIAFFPHQNYTEYNITWFTGELHTYAEITGKTLAFWTSSCLLKRKAWGCSPNSLNPSWHVDCKVYGEIFWIMGTMSQYVFHVTGKTNGWNRMYININ